MDDLSIKIEQTEQLNKILVLQTQQINELKLQITKFEPLTNDQILSFLRKE